MRNDEAFSFLFFADRPLRDALSSYPAPNNHLGNTLLMHYAWRVLGNEPWALRLPALAAGIATIPATFLFARRAFSERTAVLAAALVAVSSQLVEFSTNARGYSVVCLCFLLLLALVPAIAAAAGWRGLALFGVISVVGLYFIPLMAMGVAIAALWAVLEARRRPGAPLARVVARLAVVLVLVAAVTLGLYEPVLGQP